MIRLAAVGAFSLAWAAPVLAGPPYETDDPEPTELGHWEIYNFVDLDGRAAQVDGAAGLDLNYGAANGLQLTATLPIAFAREPGSRWHAARGELELGVKYRFLKDDQHGWQAAVFPRVILPTAAGGFGGNRARLLLPLWVQKDIGRTSVFGGGGYEINPGSGNRDFWQTGVAVTHDFSDKLSLGAEAAWQSPDTRGGRGNTDINLGMIRKLGGPFALLLAAGPSFSAGKASYHSYAALSLNF
jgi:hypothetical protein